MQLPYYRLYAHSKMKESNQWSPGYEGWVCLLQDKAYSSLLDQAAFLSCSRLLFINTTSLTTTSVTYTFLPELSS